MSSRRTQSPLCVELTRNVIPQCCKRRRDTHDYSFEVDAIVHMQVHICSIGIQRFEAGFWIGPIHHDVVWFAFHDLKEVTT